MCYLSGIEPRNLLYSDLGYLAGHIILLQAGPSLMWFFYAICQWQHACPIYLKFGKVLKSASKHEYLIADILELNH